MTPVQWTETALGDLESIRDYIRHDSPVMAQVVVTRLYESVGLLVDNPDAGRVVPERDDPVGVTRAPRRRRRDTPAWSASPWLPRPACSRC